VESWKNVKENNNNGILLEKKIWNSSGIVREIYIYISKRVCNVENMERM